MIFLLVTLLVCLFRGIMTCMKTNTFIETNRKEESFRKVWLVNWGLSVPIENHKVQFVEHGSSKTDFFFLISHELCDYGPKIPSKWGAVIHPLEHKASCQKVPGLIPTQISSFATGWVCISKLWLYYWIKIIMRYIWI